MKVLIFGAGGVGSVVGGFMARTGHEVALLGRPAHLDVVRRQGLTISGIWGDYRIKAFDLYTDADALAAERRAFDLIVVTVKAYDTASAAQHVAALAGEGTAVLSLQNGLGNVETFTAALGADRYLPGRVIFGVELAPGQARVTVEADPIAVGRAPGSARPVLAPEKAAALLSSCKLPAQAVPDIVPVIWAKVIYNCALNPICALKGIPYGDILKDAGDRARMEAVVREAYAVAAAHAVRLDPPDAGAFLERLVTRLIPRTAAHFPSMARDLARGRTDVDALNGAVRRLGEAKGVPTPVNAALTEEVHAREKASSGG